MLCFDTALNYLLAESIEIVEQITRAIEDASYET